MAARYGGRMADTSMSDGVALDERRIDPGDWPEAVAAVAGPQIVVGGPGTGKTEFLVRRCIHLLTEEAVPASDVLVLGFARRGVADLATRVRRRLERSIPALDVATFHSFAARLVEAHAARAGWERPPTILTGPEQVALVHELIETSDPTVWSQGVQDLLGSHTFAREVTDFVLRASEQLLDDDAIRAAAAGRDLWRGLPAFLARYRAELRTRGRIDYGTLLVEAVHLLDDAEVWNALGGGPRFLLVDEYQDTTTAQVRLLERLSRRHRNLTVAADPYQSVYSFRGASYRHVVSFPDDYPADDAPPPRRLVLTTSFRTPGAILDAAVQVTSRELPGAAGPVTPAPGDGRVDVYRFGQQTEEAEWIASEVQRLHLAERIPYGDMAVFVRSKRRFLPDLSRSLERRRVPHDLPDSRLADQPAVRFVLDTVVAATGCEGPAGTTRAMRRMLLGPLFALPLGTMRDLERRRARAGGTWPSAVAALVPASARRGPGPGGLAALLDDPSWADRLPAADGFWALWSHLPQIRHIVDDPARADERAAWRSLAQVLARWNERNPQATLLDYRRLTEEEDFEAQPLLSYRRARGDRLTLTTLHQSKGLEFEVVFIADAVEGVFPDLRARDSLLGVRHLLPHLPADAAAYRAFRLQEERRLAYTAMTRARRRVVWTATATGFDEGQGVPSRFLPLVAGTPTGEEAATRPPRPETPTTPNEAEAVLRRLAADPAGSRGARLAAIAVLAEGERWGLRSASHLAGVRTRGSDTGLIGDRLVLSPSQAESYALCPRRYALERRLHVGDEPSVYAAFGLLVHQVLEDTERLALDRGDAHGTVEEALAALDRVFEPTVFGGGPFATAWYRRAVDALRRLYRMWPSTGRVAAVEREVHLELGGVAWMGRADRIERDDEGIRIVDYKSTRSVPKEDDIASSLQLGFYMLAAAADPEIGALGPIVAAETWYPAARTKTKVTTRAFAPDRLAEVREQLVAAGAGIAAEDWTPLVGPGCERCRVREVCPEWPEGGEAFT